VKHRRHWWLQGYLAGISLVGLPMLGVAVLTVDPANVQRHAVTVLVAVAILVAGELKPIPIARGADAGDELSISSTIGVALLLLMEPGVACAAQALALFIDEMRGRRAWDRLAFNVSQYTLSLLAARVAFAALTSTHVFSQPGPFVPIDLPAALTAAVVFFVFNNGFTGVAVALAIREPIRTLVPADMLSHLPTHGVLLALAPVIAQAMSWSLGALPLLLVPVLAVHRSARLASDREHEALHDALTGLPNRSLFLARLRQACDDIERRPLAVMLLDLDHFKEINDTLGHHVGDLLLVQVAARLRSSLREGDLVARLGGDEFAILAFHADTEVAATETATRVRAAFESSFAIADAELAARCSIGVALAPRDGRDEDLLLKRADVALYDAKGNRGAIAMYDHDRDDHSIERLGLVAELRAGLRAGDIIPLFQPQVEAGTGEVIGVEALVRWRHPQWGMMAPSAFLDVAEGAGLLDDLTDVLLASALAQLRQWHDAGHMLQLAVNVSPRTLRDQDFPLRIQRALLEGNVDPQWLTVEITEHVLATEASKAISSMARLRRLGCRIAIDDFGTGYSSLAYLKQLPVDELKIDRAFVAGLGTDPQDEIIVRATIDLGHRFGLSVTAEGVEDERAWSMLTTMGADSIQGFLISRPVAAADVSALLKRQVHLPPQASTGLQVI
jgi:diguanylate cyclase (GGDEF)-like protein